MTKIKHRFIDCTKPTFAYYHQSKNSRRSDSDLKQLDRHRITDHNALCDMTI